MDSFVVMTTERQRDRRQRRRRRPWPAAVGELDPNLPHAGPLRPDSGHVFCLVTTSSYLFGHVHTVNGRLIQEIQGVFLHPPVFYIPRFFPPFKLWIRFFFSVLP